MMSSSSSSSIIEHVVLFKVKDDVSKSEIDSMVKGVNSLVSLQETLHLSMGPLIRRVQSFPTSSSQLNFTHILHTRFTSKENLHAYSEHPAHVSVIKASTPFLADIMAVDWLTDPHGHDAVVLPPGSAFRVTLFKFKEEGLVKKDEVLGAIRGIQQENINVNVRFNCGENFSPGRAKGFSIASLAVFPGLAELELADSAEEIGKYHGNDKIKHHLETLLVLDYVLPQDGGN